MLVGDQHVDPRQFGGAEAVGGGGVVDHTRALLPRQTVGLGRLRPINFVLGHQPVARGHRRQLRRRSRGVSAGNDDDLVFSACVYGDHGQPGSALDLSHAGQPDAVGAQLRQRGWCLSVRADCADHVSRGPIAGSGQRLIGALATGQSHVAVGFDGLPRTG